MHTFIKTSRILAAGILALAAASCDDGDDTLGASLVGDKVSVEEYTPAVATGRSVTSPAVQSRSIVQLLGLLEAKGFGRLHSDIVTQFTPASVINTTNFTPEGVDSVKLCLEMYAGDMTGDSVVPMGVQVHRLVRALPSPIYSDFNPTGYYDPQVYASAMYVPSGIGMTGDSLLNSPTRTVAVDLPKELGAEVLRKYSEDQKLFYDPAGFADWFKGFYITNSWGSGRVIRISRTSVRIYQGTNSFMLMAVTPEVVNNSDMSLDIAPELQTLASSGRNIIVAPVGYDVEFEFPARAIIDHYRSRTGDLAVVNALSFSIPARLVTNTLGIVQPTNLLMVRSSKMAEFFAQNQIPDGEWTFSAVYNSLTMSYDFSDMKAYIQHLLKQDEVTEDDFHFTLTPVNVTTESNTSSGVSYVTNVSPYVGEPKMVELMLDQAKVSFTFSNQTVDF